MMLFVQVILGGSAVVFPSFPIIYHLVWGTLTFIVLIVATVLAMRDYGSASTLFKVAIASIVDFVVQGILGLIALGSDVFVVVHLTNAFLLAVIVTYLISFADTADRAAATLRPQASTIQSK